MLTIFHAEQFSLKISQLEIEEGVKDGFNSLVSDFLKDLLSMADFDISELSQEDRSDDFKSIIEKAKYSQKEASVL